MEKTGNYLIDMHNEGHAATEANSQCSAGLCVKPGPECKYWEFYNSVSCLFAEGVEFMTKSEIYDAIKKDWAKLNT